jgi:hypothetical protein
MSYSSFIVAARVVYVYTHTSVPLPVRRHRGGKIREKTFSYKFGFETTELN